MLDWHQATRHPDGSVEMPWYGVVLLPAYIQGVRLCMETGESYRVVGVSYPRRRGCQWVGLARVAGGGANA